MTFIWISQINIFKHLTYTGLKKMNYYTNFSTQENEKAIENT